MGMAMGWLKEIRAQLYDSKELNSSDNGNEQEMDQFPVSTFMKGHSLVD